MVKIITFLMDNFFSRLSKANKKLFVIYRMSKVWHELVPETFAELTFPIKISEENGLQACTLIVGAASSAVSGQLYYHKAEIISKANSYFVNTAITDIKIVLVSMKHTLKAKAVDRPRIKDPPQCLDGLDADLRASLLELFSGLKN